MINNISEFIAQKWVDKNIISEEDYDYTTMGGLWFYLIYGCLYLL